MDITTLFAPEDFEGVTTFEDEGFAPEPTLRDLLAAHAPAAKAPAKRRIVAFSQEYFAWLKELAKPRKVVAALKKLVQEREHKEACPCCEGTGVYVGRSYTTRCARCKGKGFLYPADIQARKKWEDARNAGLPRVREDLGSAFNFA